MKKIIHALWLVAVSFSVFSCTSEQELDPVPTTKGGKAEVMLRLKAPSDYTSPASRSLSYADENTIDNVYVFVFNKENTLVNIKPGTNLSSSAGNSNPSYSGEGSFTVTLDASKTQDDTYKLVLLANAYSVIENTTGFDVSKITKKQYPEVMAEIYGEIKGAMYSSSADNKSIPMWGESDQQAITKGSSKLTLELTRALARIDVGVGAPLKGEDDIWTWDGLGSDGKPIPFKLGHVYVIKPNNSYAVVRDITKDTKQPTVPASAKAFEVDESISKFGFTATSSNTGGYSSRDIYVPEAGINGEPGDSNHTNRMAIVVGGYYNGNPTETFYRIDFIVDGSLINVLRNHLYQFNISKVSGNGYPDAETAYNSRSMNMAVEINEWNVSDMGNIVFDGQNTLSVSQDQYNLSAKKREERGEDNLLCIMTDYIDPVDDSKSGWYVEKIVDAENDQQVDWLSLSEESGVPDKKAEVFLKVDKYTVGADRKAIIWIAAGRLRYAVNVTQSSLRWGCSNIVWDGSKLTFAVTPAENASIPANSQGVFFQWGSLVAIVPSAISDQDTTYVADKYPNGHILYDPTGLYNYNWLSVPSCKKDIIGLFSKPYEDNFATYNDNTGFDAAAGKGDICRYISSMNWVDGKWRLPTMEEYDLLEKAGDVSNGGNFDDIKVSPDNGTGSNSNAYGFFPITAGRWFGPGVDANPAAGVYFPAAGSRTSPHGGAERADAQGFYWTASSLGDSSSLFWWIHPKGGRWGGIDYQCSFSMRCVQD